MTSLSPNASEPTTTMTSPGIVAPLAADNWARREGAALKVQVQRPGHGVVVLHAEGELDSASEVRLAEPLRHRLTCTAGTVVLDLSGVTFLDTTGAVTLLEGAARAQSHDKQLLMISSPAVDRVLRLIDVNNRFTYANGLDDIMAGRPLDFPPGRSAKAGRP